MIFDPTMTKKKKKKKKQPFMPEEDAGDGMTEESQPVEPKEVEPEGQEEKEFDADEDEGRKKGESPGCRHTPGCTIIAHSSEHRMEDRRVLSTRISLCTTPHRLKKLGCFVWAILCFFLMV